MQVYKTFFKIAKKHLTSSIIFTGIFLVIIFMLSTTAKEENASRFEADSVSIAVLDEDNSLLSQAICDYLDTRHEIISLRDYTDEALTDNLFYQRISYALTIPTGFEEKFLAGEGENSLLHSMRQDSASGVFVNRQVDAFLNSVETYLLGGYELADAIRITAETLETAPAVKILSFDTTSSGGNDTMFYYFQYLSYALIMIFSNGLVPILIAFQKEDLRNRISCSATGEKKRRLQIGLGCITYSLIIWVFFLIVAILLFHPANLFTISGLMCILNSFVYTLIMTAFTLVLGCFNLTDNALNLVANIVGLGMSFLCGVFVPQWLLGENVLAVGKFLPAYWYIKIINMISGWSGEAFSTEAFRRYLGIQCIFLVAIFSIYLVANKQTIKRR